jgi:hypothetical protein
MLARLGVCGRQPSTEIAAPTKQSSSQHWQFSKAHIGSRTAHGFQTSVRICLYNKIMQATSIQNHDIEIFRNIGQGEADIESINRLNLAAVMHTTVQVNRFPF